MPAVVPNRFLMDVYGQYPDDDTIKQVVLKAKGNDYTPPEGDRHVLIEWSNGVTSSGKTVYQFIQLLSNPGNYAYYSPHAKIGSDLPRESNACFVLGEYTREQRDEVLKIANNTPFKRKSIVNSCRMWTRDVLEKMVERGLLKREIFVEIDASVPLKRRVPEVLTNWETKRLSPSDIH